MAQMMRLLWPCDRRKVWISSTWQAHLQRPGYLRPYAGLDLAGAEQPLRPCQLEGRVLQAMWSTQGYGYTVLIEYAGLLRTRVAHLKDLGVQVGALVDPTTYLGRLDSTGNSSGPHVHWEVWRRFAAGWQNVDPLDPAQRIELVNQPAELSSLSAQSQAPAGSFTPPAVQLPLVRTSALVSSWVNLREGPCQTARKTGEIRPGQSWEVAGSLQDVLGNWWYALRRERLLGWAAAYYGGEQWLEEVQQEEGDT